MWENLFKKTDKYQWSPHQFLSSQIQSQVGPCISFSHYLLLTIFLVYLGLCQDDGHESLMESAVIVKESEEDENDELNNLEENPKDNTGVYVFDSIKEVGNENGTLEEGDDANIEGATEVLAAVSEEGSNPDFEIVENESTQNLSVDSESGSTKVEMVSENCDKSANSEPEVEQSMKLPDTVTHIVSRCGVNVYIVGTAHFSHESQEDVAKVRLMPNIFLSNLKKNV